MFVISAASALAASLPALFMQPRELTLVTSPPRLQSIRIVSWNIDRGTELERITEALRRLSPDLCLLQEVDWGTNRTNNNDVAASLAQRLHLNMSYGVEFEELGQERDRPAYTGQATLSDLAIRNSRILRFSKQSGYWQPHRWIPSGMPLLQRRLGSRIALVTEMTYQGRPLVVYNAHLESRSYGRIQLDQLDEILSDLNHQYPPDIAAIIAGDLNSKYLPSIFLRKLERAGFRSATGERIQGTAFVMALDWIFLRGPYQFQSGKVRKEFKGSDHYPVYAELAAR